MVNLKTKGYPQICERDFLKQVIDLAHIFGWKIAHFRPAKTEHGWRTAVQADGAGFPDLVMIRNGMLIFCELKSEAGKFSPEQEAWGKDLKIVADHSLGVMYFVWRPDQIDEIAEVLR